MPRVLIVEDSPTQAAELAFYLEDAGFEVVLATDAEQALSTLAEDPDLDLVASDVVMPGKSGYELCRELKSNPRTRGIPVVLLTSLRDPGELLEALDSGADSFLSKPVDPDELIHRLQSVLAGKALRLSDGRAWDVNPDDRVHFHFRGKIYSASADPDRLVNYFTAAFEDFLGAREREQAHAVAEAALRESTRFLQATVDALPISIAILDERGAIMAVNAVWQGAPDGDPLCHVDHGTGTDFLGHCRDLGADGVQVASRLAEALEAILSGRRESFEHEYPGDGADGVRWFRVQVTRFQDAGQERVVVAHKEITARKRAEQDLIESNRRLGTALTDLKSAQATVVAQERLRALGTMASGIAHDFNNALAPILGYSEQLLIQKKVRHDDEKLVKRLELICTSARDAAEVVSRLREFARPKSDESNFAAVKLHELVDTVIELTRPRWKHEAHAKGLSIELVTEFEDVPEVPGNESEIRELLTNLIFNAVDALPEGGTVTFGLRGDGDRVRLEVRDNGTGMTEEQRSRCLEPFFTTKGAHGTGLGLAMVYGITKRHNAEFAIESELGVGTACVIRFPPMDDAESTADEIIQAGTVGLLRVLVVDDEQVNRDVVRGYLELDGHEVVTAGSAETALAAIDGGGFDLVITDRAMPDMSGDQIAAAVKQSAPGTPVVLLTGFGELMDAAGESPDGVDVVLCKPVGQADLRGAIARALLAVGKPVGA